MRHLIVNADDFGLSPGVNAGIVQAHEHGIVTSASLMVRQPAAEAAAAYAIRHPRLGLGLHIDLGEWTLRDGVWYSRYERVPPNDAAAVKAEVHDQLERFRMLVGRDPDHLDSHQHVHRREPAASIVAALARSLRLPLRGDGSACYVGDFYGQDEKGTPYPECVSVDLLLRLVDALPPGYTELSCHPGRVAAGETLGGTTYRLERNLELAALCDARVRKLIECRGIRLCSYAQVDHGPGMP